MSVDGDRAVPQTDREFVVMVSHWNLSWDVFVLDPAQGLIASTNAATLAEVESAAHAALSRNLGVPARGCRLTVIRS